MTPVQGGVCYRVRKESFPKSRIFLSALFLRCQCPFRKGQGWSTSCSGPELQHVLHPEWGFKCEEEYVDLMLREGTPLLAQPFMLSPRQQATLEHSPSTLTPVDLMCTRVRPDFPELQEKR